MTHAADTRTKYTAWCDIYCFQRISTTTNLLFVSLAFGPGDDAVPSASVCVAGPAGRFSDPQLCQRTACQRRAQGRQAGAWAGETPQAGSIVQVQAKG